MASGSSAATPTAPPGDTPTGDEAMVLDDHSPAASSLSGASGAAPVVDPSDGLVPTAHDLVNPSWTSFMECTDLTLARLAVVARWLHTARLVIILCSWSPGAIVLFWRKWLKNFSSSAPSLGPWGTEAKKQENIKIIVESIRKFATAVQSELPAPSGKTRSKSVDPRFAFLSDETRAAVTVDSADEKDVAASSSKKTSSRGKKASTGKAKAVPAAPAASDVDSDDGLDPEVLAAANRLPSLPRGSPPRAAAASSSVRTPPVVPRTSGRGLPGSKGRPLLLGDDGGDGGDEPSDGSGSEDGDYIPSDDGSDDVQYGRGAAVFPSFANPRLAKAMASLGSVEGFAHDFLENVLADGAPNVYSVYKYNVVFKNNRNGYECLALAKIVDALLNRDRRTALELACRRLAGVQTADKANNWGLCHALELNHQERSFVPPRVLARIIKEDARLKALEASGDDPPKSKGNHHKQKKGTGGNPDTKGDKSAGSKK
jgi:hypothetical protein